eukprot:TRINITY_DN1458_c0_g1_i2.p1 TRINITY_DN1458_c0_g1~~TRINITY_DN1458_c0_g1_i2.p1  ORF type:complete len:302 (+),score=63.60 TRINITY_DN1458_c0_g1_i2:510-1415(+)
MRLLVIISSSGGLIEITERVVSKKLLNGFAIVRPPGHHAEPSYACGFCLYNNVAVAVQVARKTMGVNKALIVDWDVHHGNGTQHVFETDPNVLYFSIHRHDGGTFYPKLGAAEEIGVGKGKGFTVNMPWSFVACGDAEYVSAFERILLPIAREFKPDIVFISSGFDCAKGDPIGGMEVTPSGFAKMTELCLSISDGRVVMALEGGYDLLSLSASAAFCVRVLLGEKAPEIRRDNLCPNAESQIEHVIRIQRSYWTCFDGVELKEIRGPLVSYLKEFGSHFLDYLNVTDEDNLEEVDEENST